MFFKLYDEAFPVLVSALFTNSSEKDSSIKDSLNFLENLKRISIYILVWK